MTKVYLFFNIKELNSYLIRVGENLASINVEKPYKGAALKSILETRTRNNLYCTEGFGRFVFTLGESHGVNGFNFKHWDVYMHQTSFNQISCIHFQNICKMFPFQKSILLKKLIPINLLELISQRYELYKFYLLNVV